MGDEVLKLLELLGYVEEEGDRELIDTLLMKVLGDIKCFCNIDEVPEGLVGVVLFRCVGEFISAKKNCGLTGGFVNLNFEPVLSQISEGDTSVSYNIRNMRSDERRLSLLAAALTGFGKSQLVRYRRMLW